MAKYKDTETKVCAVCGVLIQRPPRRPVKQWENQKVCSVPCRQKYIAAILKSRWKEKKCSYCGDVITKRESRRLFCGVKCQAKAMTGSGNPIWKGGRKKHGEYTMLLVKGHPMSDRHGYIFEHRYVLEQDLVSRNIETNLLVTINGQKYLNPSVIVHHKNHNKSDNRIENLHPVLSQKEHFHFNYCPHCPHCNKSGELMGTPSGTIMSQAEG